MVHLPQSNLVRELGSDQGSQGNQKRKACHHGDVVGRWWWEGYLREVVEESALSKSLKGHRVGRGVVGSKEQIQAFIQGLL